MSREEATMDTEDPSDASSDAEGVEDGATSAPAEAGNQGWADVLSRLLTAPAPKKKYVILSKAKKAMPKDEAVEEVEEEESDPGFDVDGAETKTVEKKTKRKTAVRSRAAKRKEDIEKRKKLREWEILGRRKPDVIEKDRERMLCKIATRGVVQLFNAVRTQQADVKTQLEDAGSSIRKTERALKSVSKESFLERLRDGADAEPMATEQEMGSEERATWSVLRDDYLPEAGLKDWDQDSDAHEDSGSAGESDGSL